MNISKIRDYVENDKPIAGTVAKDWLRYLLQENETLRQTSVLIAQDRDSWKESCFLLNEKLEESK